MAGYDSRIQLQARACNGATSETFRFGGALFAAATAGISCQVARPDLTIAYCVDNSALHLENYV